MGAPLTDDESGVSFEGVHIQGVHSMCLVVPRLFSPLVQTLCSLFEHVHLQAPKREFIFQPHVCLDCADLVRTAVYSRAVFPQLSWAVQNHTNKSRPCFSAREHRPPPTDHANEGKGRKPQGEGLVFFKVRVPLTCQGSVSNYYRSQPPPGS